ncbi:hypothetical protein H4R19_005057 [Coemansia spiralis]|nr:hypothetical protein H4R19_005057 [Coemansia spiralis]
MGADMDLIQQQLRGPADSPPYQGSALVASPTADATTSGSSAHALARCDTATASEGGLGLPFLGQATASTANIMTFTAGSSSTYLPDSEGPASPVRNLIGATVTTGAALRGLDEQPGVYFVFPDLSIRKDGTYRMMFRFFDLRGQSGDLLASETKIQATAYSDAFRVYSAKQFPGMMESTPLSKHFARQGVKIPVRKEAGKSDPDP